MKNKNKGFYKLPKFQVITLWSFIIMLIILHGPWAYKVVESSGICVQVYIHYVEYFLVPIIGFVSGMVMLKKTGLLGKKDDEGGEE